MNKIKHWTDLRVPALGIGDAQSTAYDTPSLEAPSRIGR